MKKNLFAIMLMAAVGTAFVSCGGGDSQDAVDSDSIKALNSECCGACQGQGENAEATVADAEATAETTAENVATTVEGAAQGVVDNAVSAAQGVVDNATTTAADKANEVVQQGVDAVNGAVAGALGK